MSIKSLVLLVEALEEAGEPVNEEIIFRDITLENSQEYMDAFLLRVNENGPLSRDDIQVRLSNCCGLFFIS